MSDNMVPKNPDRLIRLNPEQRQFLEEKQNEYRQRAERATSEKVQKVVDDAYYKLIVLGILFRTKPSEVTIGEVYDELVSTDGKDNVDLPLLENAFGVIEAYNRRELHRVVTTFQKGEQKRGS